MSQIHSSTLELLAKGHRADMAAEARNNRLVREARDYSRKNSTDPQTPLLSVVRVSRARFAAVMIATALALGAVAGAAIGSTTDTAPAAGPAAAAPAEGHDWAGSGGTAKGMHVR